jgi:hypothetical protein
MEKPKTHADIRRENFHEHGRAALALADLALAQIDETLSDCGQLLSEPIENNQMVA